MRLARVICHIYNQAMTQNRISVPSYLFRFVPIAAAVLVGLAFIARPIIGAPFHIIGAPVGGGYTNRQVAEAKLATGTKKLLENTAEHLSKMQGGASVGGFPGFEPPEDDEKYRRKIENESHTGEEINH